MVNRKLIIKFEPSEFGLSRHYEIISLKYLEINTHTVITLMLCFDGMYVLISVYGLTDMDF